MTTTRTERVFTVAEDGTPDATFRAAHSTVVEAAHSAIKYGLIDVRTEAVRETYTVGEVEQIESFDGSGKHLHTVAFGSEAE